MDEKEDTGKLYFVMQREIDNLRCRISTLESQLKEAKNTIKKLEITVGYFRRINMERFIVWLKNTQTFHHRIMMRYLRKRGWVVFYLEETVRECNVERGGTCWLKLYQSGLLQGEAAGTHLTFWRM